MNVAILFSSLTGMVLSFILFFFNKGYKTANRYLAGFFFFISLFILSQYSGLYGQSEILAAILASGPTPFVFLIGPLCFLYIRSVLRDNSRFSVIDYFHFLLFLLEFIGMVPYFFSSWEYKLSVARTLLSNDWHVTHLSLNWIFVSPINSFLRPLHITLYAVLSWVLMSKYYRTSKYASIPSAQSLIVKRWLYIYTIVYTVFAICYCLLSVNLLIYSTKKEFQDNSFFLLLAASVTVICLNLFTLLFPQILYGLPRIINPVTVKEEDKPVHSETEKEETAAFQEDGNHTLILGMTERLEELYKSTQPWTDKNFTISTLAIHLDIPEHHLRYYFNHDLALSFSEYRNHLRVAHVKQLLQDEQLGHLSIEGIGAQAGFPSKSTFFAVFKKETGLTPKEYQEQFQRGQS